MSRCPFTLASIALMAILRGLAAQQSEFRLPQYTSEQRWTRSAEMVIYSQIKDIMEKKARGMTPEAIGEEVFKAFGPPRGWNTSNTPFLLLRGMYFNWMSHPQQMCEMQVATDTLVKAQCNRPYADLIRRSGVYGVTIEEYETVGRVFAQAVARHHSMEWLQEPHLDHWVVTVRKK